MHTVLSLVNKSVAFGVHGLRSEVMTGWNEYAAGVPPYHRTGLRRFVEGVGGVVAKVVGKIVGGYGGVGGGWREEVERKWGEGRREVVANIAFFSNGDYDGDGGQGRESGEGIKARCEREVRKRANNAF